MTCAVLLASRRHQLLTASLSGPCLPMACDFAVLAIALHKVLISSFKQDMEDGAPTAARNWLCWFCPRVFLTQASRHHHISVKHPRENLLVPPLGFVDLHLRTPRVENRHHAGLPARAGADRGVAPATVHALGAASQPPDNVDEGSVVLRGVGAFHIPAEGYQRGTLPSFRPRTVLLTSISARIKAYYEAMPETSRTRRLVPPSVGEQPSRFNTPLLRVALKFALSAGGAGLSTADQRSYVSLLLMVEASGAGLSAHGGRRGGAGARKRPRPPNDAGDESAQPVGGSGRWASPARDADDCSDAESGELARAFPKRSAFDAAVRGEQRRVLSKLRWDETPLEVEGATYLFYSRDLLFAVLDVLQNARHVQLWGEKLGVAPDGSRLRAEIMDSDLLLSEEAVVRRRHGSLSFVLAVQLFVDEAVVSWSGAHYMYPIRARVVNVRDRSVQWVTVAYIPHVGKPVARTAAARLRASDGRNSVLQRCLAVFLRRFVVASQEGAEVVFPMQHAMIAVPRLLGLVADQLKVDLTH